jgi:xanthine dehydrogenase molybdenum-binding subunit
VTALHTAETTPDIELTVNGADDTVRADHPHLLSALRNQLGLTSPKDGCSPSGQCGCCTVLLDGKAVVSCVTSVERAAGSTVTTLEGLDDAERDRLARGFAAAGALQCGFCTPGIVVRAKALIDQKGAALDRRTIEGRLGAHLCRCTGYVKIIDAIELLASGEAIQEPKLSHGLGKQGTKYQGPELALGDRDFIGDMTVPGMLHAALKLTDHARAEIVAIDTARAGAVEGVRAVLTAADIPGQLKVGLIHKDWPVMIPVGARTSYAGDVLAVVVADDVATAHLAADLVDVEYDVLEPFTDARTALESSENAVWGLEGNELSRSVYARGDFDRALADSAFT